jgi:putative peptidoglycan lipid II flippase
MQAAALQIPVFVLGILFVRLNSALNQNYVLAIIATTSVFANVVLNRLFLKWIGLPGIALSTACVYGLSLAIAAVFSIHGLSRRMQTTKAKPVSRPKAA